MKMHSVFAIQVLVHLELMGLNMCDDEEVGGFAAKGKLYCILLGCMALEIV